MNKKETYKVLTKIFENYSQIVGIRVNGIFYDVDCFDTDIIISHDLTDSEDVNNLLKNDYETLVYTYQLDENNCYIEYNFSVADLTKAKDIVLYKLEKI